MNEDSLQKVEELEDESPKEKLGPKNLYTLKEYIAKKGGNFVIPEYQRGYIWGQERKDEKKDSVTNLIDTLLNEFNSNKKDIFLQGITVYENENEIMVVDGQQRTTFFYLLLNCLSYKEDFKIKYKIRDKSDEYLKDIKNHIEKLEDYKKEDKFQDIYFFKKTLNIFKEKINKEINKEEFLRYILEHVKFLYISIPKDKATLLFSMMNGNKALMQDFELIKADLLRRASLGTGGHDSKAAEWDNISLRSRYAHEWDKWLHWWNRKEVQLMYFCDNPMGWLLKTIFNCDNNLYDAFKKSIDKNEGKSDAQKAKLMFAELRVVQKHFEEVFSNKKLHNDFGLIIRLLKKEDIISFLVDYFKFKDKYPIFKNLELVYNLLLFEVPYKGIRDEKYDDFNNKKEKLKSDLLLEPIYGINNELAYRYLLIRNVERDSALNRYFDFTSWKGNRSLEHIYPKSKVVHKYDNDWLSGVDECVRELDGLEYDFKCNCWKDKEGKKKDNVSEYILRESIKNDELSQKGVHINEHSLGNLLLLYGRDNSAFGNKTPENKRMDYFNPEKDILPSRNLLHTIFSFGRHEHFRGAQICENHLEAINDVEKRIEKLECFFTKNRVL